METKSTAADKLAERIAGYQRIHDWMLAHPEIEFCSVSVFDQKVSAQISGYGEGALDRFTAAARALKDGAPFGSVRKDLTETLYSVARDFGAVTLSIYTSRSAVCEAVVVGKETVRVPDPKAPTVEIERDIVEWQCSPMLSITDDEQVPA